MEEHTTLWPTEQNSRHPWCKLVTDPWCRNGQVAVPAKKTSEEGFVLSVPSFRAVAYDSIFAVPGGYWESAAPAYNLFLQRSYLELLENFPPEGLRFGYLVFFHTDTPVGVAVLQRVNFNAARNIRMDGGADPGPQARSLKQWIARQVDLDLLICGSLLLTGEHGFYIDPRYAGHLLAGTLLEEALSVFVRQLDAKGEAIDAVLIKDLFLPGQPMGEAFTRASFFELQFQPCMVLDLPKEWKSFDDYLSAMSSKYRVRARRALKKAAPLVRQELDAHAIRIWRTEINRLYRRTAEGAEFNMIYLHPEYFAALKEAFPEDFRLWGYFLDGEMIGFCTALYNGEELEAHFLGMEETHNRQFQLYLNMLYHLIAEGVSRGVSQIVFARTALEIKSSVGATAQETFVYLRHRRALINRMVRPLVRYLDPGFRWEARHPFKEEETGPSSPGS